ncbi:MAG: sulfotransferase [Alphaproteobacteria bacterium]|nr:sulfotransferase [Alphaproteobacteria bacterium]
MITKIMDAHPDVCGPSPLHILRVLGIDHYRYGDLSNKAVWNQLLDDVTAILQSDFAKWATNFSRDELAIMADQGDLPTLLRAIFAKEARANGKKIVFIKELWAYQYLPFLDWCFPGCRFLYQVRDPRDMALSWRTNEDHPGGLVRGARAWMQDQLQVMKSYGTHRNSGRAAIIRYEDLLTDPKMQLTKVCDLFGLEYTDEMLKYHENKLTRANAEKYKFWGNIGQELISDNFNKFKSLLTEKEIAIVERVCWGALQYFGYEATTPLEKIKAVSGAMIRDLEVHEAQNYKARSSAVRVHDQVQNRLRRSVAHCPGM